MPDEDQNEPDDTIAQAHPIQFTSVGTTQTATGRLAYVGDRGLLRNRDSLPP